MQHRQAGWGHGYEAGLCGAPYVRASSSKDITLEAAGAKGHGIWDSRGLGPPPHESSGPMGQVPLQQWCCWMPFLQGTWVAQRNTSPDWPAGPTSHLTLRPSPQSTVRAEQWGRHPVVAKTAATAPTWPLKDCVPAPASRNPAQQEHHTSHGVCFQATNGHTGKLQQTGYGNPARYPMESSTPRMLPCQHKTGETTWEPRDTLLGQRLWTLLQFMLTLRVDGHSGVSSHMCE